LIGRERANADYAASLARIDVCPLAVQTGALRWMPCVTSDLGQMVVTGRPINGVTSETDRRFWADVGLSAALRLSAQPLFVELELSGLRPLTRPTYVISYGGAQPHEDSIRPVPALFASGMLGLGVEL
jgi:hypothetical protein